VLEPGTGRVEKDVILLVGLFLPTLVEGFYRLEIWNPAARDSKSVQEEIYQLENAQMNVVS
jgi:hypothetical protein